MTIYIYTLIYAYTHMYIYIHTHIYVYIYMSIHIYVSIYICISLTKVRGRRPCQKIETFNMGWLHLVGSIKL